MDFRKLFTIARQFQGTNPGLEDILPFVNDKFEALAVQEVLNGTAKRSVSVVTAYLDNISGEWVNTGESLDSAVEAEVARLEDAGFVVLERDAGGGTGDGGDYHTVVQYVRFGMPPLNSSTYIERTEVPRYNARRDQMQTTRAYRVWFNGQADVRHFLRRKDAKEALEKYQRDGKIS